MILKRWKSEDTTTLEPPEGVACKYCWCASQVVERQNGGHFIYFDGVLRQVQVENDAMACRQVTEAQADQIFLRRALS